MNVAACLLLYSFAVAVLAPRLLVRLTRAGIAPRLGVAAWLIAIGSVVLSWIVAVAFVLGELALAWDRPGAVLSSCFATLRSVATGAHGVAVQSGVLTLAGLAAAALGVLGWRLARSLLRSRVGTHAHADLARAVGHPLPGSDAVVLPAAERLAYCVAGRPSAIVVTTAALDALDKRHLDAVLAHERAHLTGRHHLALAFSRGLATILPRVELFTTGSVEVARLLEMCADDAAVREHGRRTVLGAMLALSASAPVPADALGATGGSVIARAERLTAPPARARQWRTSLCLVAAAVVLTAGPATVAVFAATGLTLCNPPTG
ncbi:M56 family metallopeptidase [Amycolatopsis sp. NPDC006131]|uniref:M56 family metallopeptidase n=1 Tax=Amycolatopsis sp. NPDC006131 TaxID=3156731 RepID=UPI0033A428F6